MKVSREFTRLCLILLMLQIDSPASAANGAIPCDGIADCFLADGGAVVRDDLRTVGAGTSVGQSRVSVAVRNRPTRETTMVPACPGNDPNANSAYDMACRQLISSCQAGGLGPGPMTWIWSRRIDVNGAPTGPWVRTGFSCNLPVSTVGPGARPALTVAAIRDAFRQVDFALPAVNVQPEGNVTLVNLPTYFEVQWPELGVQPREIAEVQLLGRNVRIRPLGKSFLYRFGDGHQLGPTSDVGGPYPDGRIRHTYTRPARAAVVSVVATYGGEFSVDEGPWQEVGETITINGPAEGVQVREARARLEAG